MQIYKKNDSLHCMNMRIPDQIESSNISRERASDNARNRRLARRTRRARTLINHINIIIYWLKLQSDADTPIQPIRVDGVCVCVLFFFVISSFLELYCNEIQYGLHFLELEQAKKVSANA